jgi:hypothetical protein
MRFISSAENDDKLKKTRSHFGLREFKTKSDSALSRKRYEFHCDRIHAVAQASWFWTIVEDVTKMSATPCAKYFGSFAISIAHFFHSAFPDGLIKAWPACARFKFRV